MAESGCLRDGAFQNLLVSSGVETSELKGTSKLVKEVQLKIINYKKDIVKIKKKLNLIST